MRARDFRQAARDALKGNWIVAIIGGIIASMFGGLSNSGVGFTINFNFEMPEIDSGESTATLLASARNVANGGMYDGVIALLMIFFGVVLVYSIIMFIIGSAVGIGYSEFNLDLVDGSKPRISSIFSRFGQIGTGIRTNLLAFIRIFFGILLIIPGIVMSYSYAMRNYVMAEHPELNAREVLRESKRIMKGNRFRLFCLEMSFIGWALLSILTLGVGFLWFVPYQQAAIATFYREVSAEADYRI